MSISFSGCRSRSGGLISAIAKQIKLINLKPLVKITVRFDPFYEKVSETRKFLYHISGPKVTATNISCILKTEIVCDDSSPTVTYSFESGENIILKTSNLSTLELLKVFNRHISDHTKPSEDKEIVNSSKKEKQHKR
ncbi:39S ribosomal protein L53, mitochondrial [Nasonia vitripennis]|uniref:Large ribosomal subunit protein mL53 n=1 Tax=Nasonia vitripennis TaxID=7425 RepID=A0A7M6UMX2_NASVI|nr:39S ribosomal protein L53, mitochondrial [Nasonia vitripennis]